MRQIVNFCGDCPWCMLRPEVACYHDGAIALPARRTLVIAEESVPPAGCPLREGPTVVALAPGRQVFRLELPIMSRGCVKAARARGDYSFAWAPTMNEYSGLPGWQKARLRTAIDELLVIAGTRWDGWQMGIRRMPPNPKTGSPGKLITTGRGKNRVPVGRPRRRIIRLTRFSRTPPDEPGSVDSIGGKIPLDRLVAYGVLVDDSERWCMREASWVAAPAGEGRIVAEVFEMLPLPEEQQ